MHIADSELVFSATDLSNYLACPHLSLLDRRTALGGPKPPQFDDPSTEVLRQRGFEHEQKVLASLGGDVVEIEEDHVAKTLEAMRDGAPVIFQGALRSETWFGRPDFLLRVDKPSDLGVFSYEVLDAKLARDAKGGALLQLLVYADLLENAQGVLPDEVHLALGGPEGKRKSFRVMDYIAYFRSLRRRFGDHIRNAPEELPFAPDPVQHCDICGWQMRCDKERREVDHLSLVADIRTSQRSILEEHGIDTVEKLAGLDLSDAPAMERMNTASLEKIREQARIQVEGRREGRAKYELLTPVEQGEGLAALPAPSPGDLFFDIEGDPHALTYGLEYLFGFTDRNAVFSGLWALDRAEEKEMFERFIDLVMERLAKYPDMHIYHFAPYETTAVKRLMGRHATREDEVDRLLRGKVFVDLHRVVRQALRASVESYSIKKLEPLYGFDRGIELRSATTALANFEAWLELGGRETRDDRLLDEIERYNRDDCLSTLRLRDWLETLRDELAEMTGAAVPRPEPGDSEPSDELADHLAEVAELIQQLTAGVPVEPDDRSSDQQARWLLAQLLGFHRRENKATWWEYFRWLDLSDEELIEDRTTLGGLEYQGVVGEVKRSLLHRYRFPRQEHGLDRGTDVRDPKTEKSPGTIHAIDDAAGTVNIKRSKSSKKPHPRALIPYKYVSDEELRASIRRVARSVIASGLGDSATYRAVSDLLTRRPPRAGQPAGERLAPEDEPALQAGRRLIDALEGTVLPIQGPPGSGKTYTGARMIVEAMRSGKRVGITATSHKVISNLIEEVCKAAAEETFSFRGIQKASKSNACGLAEVASTNDYDKLHAELAKDDVQLVAGTAWLWSREDMIGAVDLLVIDEAGQFSLANGVAVAPAAESLILLGDPKQLDQPMQGVHPPGADVSALAHLLGGAPTMPPDRGLFLEKSWRLHPRICAFTSELFYAGRLSSKDDLARQRIHGAEPEAGLRFVPVEHGGNVNESPEEIEVVRNLVDAFVGGRWTDKHGTEKPITIEDVLVVAPYNAQVSALTKRLPTGARVGTVDKFQGQEAPVVIYSMATSSAEDAPRGMDFLFSANRLNVATSRAQALAIVVANPALFEPECRTPDQMKLANAFCRFRELAEGI